MPGRKYTAGSSYRYGFNSQEKSNDIAGDGNHTTALFGEYDTRLGRRWNLDPRPDISLSPYAVFSNAPVWFNDINLDTPRNAGNGVLGQQFAFSSQANSGITTKQMSKLQTDFLSTLSNTVNNGGYTFNGSPVSINTSDPLASVINVTFGTTGISNANMSNNSIYVNINEMAADNKLSTHEWLHTAGLMDRYYEFYGRQIGDRESQTVETQRSGVVPMGILPPGHDPNHSASNIMAGGGSQITNMQWNIVFNLGATGKTEESLGTLGKVSFVYDYSTLNPNSPTNRQSMGNSLLRNVSSNTNRMAFSATAAFHVQRGTLLAVPNSAFFDVSPASLQRYIIHNKAGNVLGSSLTLGEDWEQKQLKASIKR